MDEKRGVVAYVSQGIHRRHVIDGFLGTSSGHKGLYYRRRHFRLSALVAPPSEGLEHGANTIPDMNSTIKVLNKLAFICHTEL